MISGKQRRNNKILFTNNLLGMKKKTLFLNSILKTNKSKALNNHLLDINNLKNKYKKSMKDAKLLDNINYIERSSNKCKAASSLIKPNTQYTDKMQILVDPKLIMTIQRKIQ